MGTTQLTFCLFPPVPVAQGCHKLYVGICKIECLHLLQGQKKKKTQLGRVKSKIARGLSGWVRIN